MLKRTAVDHFGNQAGIARALGISSAAVAKWGDVVPLESATALEILTAGALVVERKRYPVLSRAAQQARSSVGA